MQTFEQSQLRKLYIPALNSHKGENGKLLLIGGSHLFHAASLWALKIASRVVDMVFYASVDENNAIVQQAKQEFRDGIVVPRDQIEKYVQEADCILIGPGMIRDEGGEIRSFTGKMTIDEINRLSDEGEQTYYLTKLLLNKYPQKKWVIDAGALQMLDVAWLKSLQGNVVLTPHVGEFKRVFHKEATAENAAKVSKEYQSIILLKGKEDIVCSPHACQIITGGNAGMTKGGTGDVLAGLTAALGCKNELFLSACAASYFNKKTAEVLYKRVGLYFNASDLADELPRVIKQLNIEK